MTTTSQEKETKSSITFDSDQIDAIINGLSQKAVQLQNAHQQVLGELNAWQTIRKQTSVAVNSENENHSKEG